MHKTFISQCIKTLVCGIDTWDWSRWNAKFWAALRKAGTPKTPRYKSRFPAWEESQIKTDWFECVASCKKRNGFPIMTSTGARVRVRLCYLADCPLQIRFLSSRLTLALTRRLCDWPSSSKQVQAKETFKSSPKARYSSWINRRRTLSYVFCSNSISHSSAFC